MLTRDFHQGPIGILLVTIKTVEPPRPGLVPLGRGQCVPFEELLQCF